MTAHNKIYNPLRSEIPQIRLVIIRPAEGISETIECDLELSSLDDRHQYEALSYVWGTHDDENKILLNGQSFTVRKNLSYALRTLCLVERPRVMWIDALCINQEDTDERSSQVLLMRQVYRSATQVLVWFIDEGGRSGAALQLLKRVREMTTFPAVDDATSDQSDIAKVRKYLDTDSWARERHPYLYSDFFRQEWWNRAWVVQEVAVSSRAVITVGENELEWSSALIVATLILLCGAIPAYISGDSGSSFSKIEGLRRMVQRGSPPSLSSLVATNRHESTDPRDQVYAFLGLAETFDGHEPLFKPDYSDSNSALAVYVSLIEYAVKSEKCLDIICMSQGHTRNDFPSWCPDWTQALDKSWIHGPESNPVPSPLMLKYQGLLPDDAWRACGSTFPDAKVIERPPTLICKGLLIDEIEIVGDPTELEHPFGQHRTVFKFRHWENLLLRYFIKDQQLKTRSPSGPSIMDVSDQFNKLILSFGGCLKINPYNAHWLVTAMIRKPFETFRQLVFWSSKSLQRLRRRYDLRVRNRQTKYGAGGTLVEAYVRTLTTNRISSIGMTDNQYKDFWNTVPDMLNDPVLPASAQTQKDFLSSISDNIRARTLLITKKGYIGLGPPKACKGDLLCVLYGCSVPVLIRKYGEHHQFVGESYIHGFMDGAAIDLFRNGTVEEREFVLR